MSLLKAPPTTCHYVDILRPAHPSTFSSGPRSIAFRSSQNFIIKLFIFIEKLLDWLSNAFFLLDHNQLYLDHFTTWNFCHRNIWSVHYQVHIWIHLLVKRIFLGFLKTTYSSKPYWSNSFHSLLSILWTTSVLNLLDFCSLQIFIWCLLTPVDVSAWVKNI